jgi:hypothetical protein
MAGPWVLVASPDEALCRGLGERLREAGFFVEVAANRDEAERRWAGADVVVVDDRGGAPLRVADRREPPQVLFVSPDLDGIVRRTRQVLSESQLRRWSRSARNRPVHAGLL